jgi:pimeloyl-ACP methyl ester carboxylesterase
MPYAVVRDVEDLQALIAQAGREAHVYAISSGAALALATAAAGPGITKLALYEPPFMAEVEDGARINCYAALWVAISGVYDLHAIEQCGGDGGVDFIKTVQQLRLIVAADDDPKCRHERCPIRIIGEFLSLATGNIRRRSTTNNLALVANSATL